VATHAKWRDLVSRDPGNSIARTQVCNHDGSASTGQSTGRVFPRQPRTCPRLHARWLTSRKPLPRRGDRLGGGRRTLVSGPVVSEGDIRLSDAVLSLNNQVKGVEAESAAPLQSKSTIIPTGPVRPAEDVRQTDRDTSKGQRAVRCPLTIAHSHIQGAPTWAGGICTSGIGLESAAAASPCERRP
jgi:hypothetical protein